MSIKAPARSPEQRLAALKRANDVRTYRKRLKADLKVGRTTVAAVLRNPPAEVETMKVWALLIAVPRVGRKKADAVLRRSRTSHSKTIGGLSVRQRDELLDLLGGVGRFSRDARAAIDDAQERLAA